MLFFRDDRGHIKKPTATYWGARLLTQEWAQPGDQSHEIYPAVSDVRNGNGDELVTAYALLRPDGLWSLLLINKDPKHAYQVRVRFRNALGRSVSTLAGPVDVFQFSGAQYQLNSDPNNPYPIKAEPPEHHVVDGAAQSVELPAYSMTVVRGARSASGLNAKMRIRFE